MLSFPPISQTRKQTNLNHFSTNKIDFWCILTTIVILLSLKSIYLQLSRSFGAPGLQIGEMKFAHSHFWLRTQLSAYLSTPHNSPSSNLTPPTRLSAHPTTHTTLPPGAQVFGSWRCSLCVSHFTTYWWWEQGKTQTKWWCDVKSIMSLKNIRSPLPLLKDFSVSGKWWPLWVQYPSRISFSLISCYYYGLWSWYEESVHVSLLLSLKIAPGVKKVVWKRISLQP